MHSTVSGRIIKPRKANSTPHQKNHRWESFTTKISKLHSLDPLRKIRRHDLDQEDLDAATSYFKNGLDKWTDLNISKPYMSFRREVLPWSDSLAQILHFQDKIFEALSRYISAYDKEALEPLLDLLTAFAHDLGARFEKYYPSALALIVQVASRPQDAAVIEWTFACLAFLFKYLSKLIVPNITPTYDTIAPLLGRDRNPPHIARFAAEALSFLVKKAAAPAHREKALPRLIQHARDDLDKNVESRQHGLYYHGLATMFAEAMKGQGRVVHTTGPEILKALIASVPSDQAISTRPAMWSDLVCAVIVSLVHHTTSETFSPILEVVLHAAQEDSQKDSDLPRSCLHIRILGTMAGVRKGSRISQWSELLTLQMSCLKNAAESQKSVEGQADALFWQQVVVNVAIVWQQAPVDTIIPCLTTFGNIMSNEPLMQWFIPFCSYFSQLDPDRFRSLFLKQFQKFVVMHWSEEPNEELLCVLLPRMIDGRGLPKLSDNDDFSLPQSWQDQIVSKFERLEVSPFPEQGAANACDKDPKTWRDKCLPKYSALLQLLEITTVRPSTYGPVAELLLRKLKLALRPSQLIATDEARFIVTQGFSAYLNMSKATGQLDGSIGPLLRAAAPRYHNLTGFLEAMIEYEERSNDKRSPLSDESSQDGEESPLLKCLIDNLAAPSHRHRLASLRLLARIDAAADQHDALAIMIQTEETALDVQNIRAISVHLRKLAMVYPNITQGSWLLRAVPAFLFGVLTVQLTPLWDAAIDALAQLASTKNGEDPVAELAFRWLEVPSKRWDGPSNDFVAQHKKGRTDFECPNLSRLHGKGLEAQEVVSDPSELLLRAFEEQQELTLPNPENARSQALKVLTSTPAIAEKRSRRLVPFFLAWNQDVSQQEVPEEEEDERVEEMSTESWSLFDKKALIKVFSQFANPKVLFQSQQVYEALLRLLGNGDVEIQKTSLKAILAWKQEGVKPYQENLEFLLDEARFKNELTVLFQGDHQIKPEHRSEVMPVLLRLLYGRTISKKGVASGRGGQHATRLAVLRQLDVQDIGGFLDIALGTLQSVRVIQDSRVHESTLSQDLLPIRKKAGFLRMVEAIIDELGESVQVYTEKMLNPVLYCLVQSCRNLSNISDDGNEDESVAENISMHRTVRLSSLKCLIALLRKAPNFEWDPYKDIIVREVISPRIAKLPVENTQGVSSIMQLIWTLSAMSKTALFLAIDERIIPQLINCLPVEKSKDEVKVFVLSIIRNLIKLSQLSALESEFNELIEEELLRPNLDLVLSSITSVLKAKGEIGKDLLTACVESVVELTPLLRQYGQAAELVDVAVFLLSEPARRVNPKVKGSILSILESMLQIEDIQANSELYDKVYLAIATLFGYFKDRTNRQALCRVLSILAKDSPVDQEVSALATKLNAFKENRMDEPDFETRLSAFNAITKPRDVQFTVREWQPLMHNMLFYIRRDEEYGVLSANAADCICKFIDVTAGLDTSVKDEYLSMLGDVVLPAMHANAKDESETVRRETVRVVGVMVATLPSWAPVSDMTGLSPTPDEKESDPSFFSNILKPATARQMRALQFLIQVNHKQELNSRNLAHFFIPLLEHFIFGKEEGSDDQGVGAQAGSTVAEVAISLDWPQYRATLRRYIGYIQSKPEMQKQLVRLLGKFVDTLAIAYLEKNQDIMEVDNNSAVEASKKRKLARTMPSTEKFSEDLLTNILPPLMDYIHEKDETTVSSRVPVGIIIVKLLKLLPEEVLNQKLPGVLTDICHILRSKAEDSRAMARDTLAKMSSLLGPSCIGFVLDELRGALTKGYQLHVLSYTMHTILVHVIPKFQPGDLDYCLDTIVAVIMDDIFGATGQEKDAEEYTSKMKEVKSSKSQDSMELIAKTASVSHLVKLVQPLQSLLMEKLDLRMVRKIDDLLSRIATGLMGNAAAESRDTLVFCYEVIQKVYESEKPEVEPKLAPRLRRYLIQKGAKKSGERGTTNKYTFKLTRFAIDVLRAVLRKHDSLRTAANIKGFIPILGDAVVAGQEEIKIATFKLLVVLVKVPFKTDDSERLYKVAAKDAIRCLSAATSTTTDIAQTSLKLMSTILRDRRDVPVKETAIDMLLGKLKDDLTEPLYRHVTFNFLRSVLERKVETAAVYDVLDYVGTIMVTNDDKDTRDLARGAFFQFLREYPQKKNRWAKQLSFVVANLQYDREGGRLSAMEIIHLLLMKSADDFVQEVATSCFIPLIMVLANDDSEKCRLAAAELLKEVFRKADKERTSKFLILVRNWLDQSDNLPVLRLGVQGFALYFEARESTSKDKKDMVLLLGSLSKVLGDYKTTSKDVELMTTVLQTMPMLIEKHPAIVLADADLWELTNKPLSHADPTVKLAGVRLLSTYLTDFYQNSSDNTDTGIITGSHGLQLTREKIQQLVTNAVGVMSPSVIARWVRKSLKKTGEALVNIPDVAEQVEVDETLATETSRVIVMLAKFLPVDEASSEEPAVDDEEAPEQDEAVSEDEWTGVDDDRQEQVDEVPAVSLQTFTTWLSDILIQETPPKAPFLVPKVAVIDILSILLATLPVSALSNTSTLYTLLTPLHHLTDPNIPVPQSADSLFTSRYESLKTKAEEAMDALQRKVGTAAYTTALMRVTEHARRRREARSRKRKIEAVAAPDRYGKWKKGKLDRKVHRRKERGMENRSRRHAY